jgi:hypothetical protein
VAKSLEQCLEKKRKKDLPFAKQTKLRCERDSKMLDRCSAAVGRRNNCTQSYSTHEINEMKQR